MTFTTGQTLTAAVLNSNPSTFSGCFNNIDATNIGAVGLYASNLNPTNATQATFGSAQNYTFPANLNVLGNFSWGGLTFGGTLYGATGNAAISGGYSAGTAGTATTGGALTFGTNSGAVTQATIAANNGSTAGGTTSSLLGVFAEPSGFNAFSIDVSGNTGIAGNLGVGGIARAQTGGISSQLLPTIINGSSFTSSANAHMEAWNIFIGGTGTTTQNFTKVFDAAPICATSYSQIGVVGATVPVISVSTTTTNVAVSGNASTFSHVICVGS